MSDVSDGHLQSMTTVRFDEGRVCEAIVQHLEGREYQRRQDVGFPEKDSHAAPIEVVFRLGARLFALEHTGIEPFEGFVHLIAEQDRFSQPIYSGVAGRFPNDDFILEMPVDAWANMKQRDIARIQRAIVEAVVDLAPKLKAAPLGFWNADALPVCVTGVPFRLLLQRFEIRGRDGMFSIKYVNDDAQARQLRITRACKKKFPKLQHWRQQHGARTILVLENTDAQITGQDSVARALANAIAEIGDAPDEIFLIYTCTEKWLVFQLWKDGQSYFELPFGAPLEIAQSTLTPLT